MGYHSLVGDMGSTLSGGQQQRLFIARALYRRPQILVMDEATSHLDVDMERVINEAIEALNITRIIISHRPETTKFAHRVIELTKGSVRTKSPSTQTTELAEAWTAPIHAHLK
jgi:ATP-binding cassette subfamily B protein RaxB